MSTPGTWYYDAAASMWKPLSTAAPHVPQFAGAPPIGSMYYGAHAPDGDYVAWETAHDTRIGVVRIYFRPADAPVNATLMNEHLSQGRLPWVSTKIPNDDWTALANGGLDDWIEETANELARVDGPAWFCLHHEPRLDGEISDFRKMWERFIPRARMAQDLSHIAFAPILNGFSFTPGIPEGPPEQWIPDADLDFIGFDSYNQWWTYNRAGGPGPYGTHQGYRRWRDVYDVLGTPAQTILSWGFRPALGEYGVHYAWDATGEKGPADSLQWMKDAYDLGLEMNFAAMYYFNTGVNSPRGTWELGVHDRPPDFTTKFNDSPAYNRLDAYLANAAKPTTFYLPSA